MVESLAIDGRLEADRGRGERTRRGRRPARLEASSSSERDDYASALAEIRSGRKRTHWMWYIFPQFEGLGFSSTSRRFSIKSREEAEAYLRHPVLGPRLVECAEAALGVEGRSAHEIFGSPDDMKLRSCATLFAVVSPAGSVFHRLLEKYFHSEPDGETLRLLGITPRARPARLREFRRISRRIPSLAPCRPNRPSRQRRPRPPSRRNRARRRHPPRPRGRARRLRKIAFRNSSTVRSP